VQQFGRCFLRVGCSNFLARGTGGLAARYKTRKWSLIA
jgi:hypothetical protein